MRLIITGGAGFIGSSLAIKSIQNQHNVCVIDKLTYAGNKDNIKSIVDHSNFYFEEEDIGNFNKLIDILNSFEPDCVLHLAAETHVDNSINSSKPFIETNVEGTHKLLEAIRESSAYKQKSIRLVHVSTDEVYGSLGKTGQFTELSQINPQSPYAASKAASDHLVLAWVNTYNMDCIVTNCSNNYGPRQHSEKLIPKIVKNAINGTPIPIYGDGQNVRDWLFVDDHSEALLVLAERGLTGQRYNIGGGYEKTNLEIARTICSTLHNLNVLEHDPEQLITFVQDRPGHDFRYAVDFSKLSAEINWSPRTSFEHGIHNTVASLLNDHFEK